MKNPLRIIFSPLSGRVYAGRVKQHEGYQSFVGQKQDVTSDFLGAIIQMAEHRGGTFPIRVSDNTRFEVSIKKVGEGE